MGLWTETEKLVDWWCKPCENVCPTVAYFSWMADWRTLPTLFYRHRSSVKIGRGKTFLPENYVWKINRIPEFSVIFAPKIIKIPEFYNIGAKTMNKVPELYMIFARKMPEFYMKIARKIFSDFFFGGGGDLPPLGGIFPPHLRPWFYYSSHSTCPT